MKYKFVYDRGTTDMDWQFEGLVWEKAEYDGNFYMDGGQFSIAVDENNRSLSKKRSRQGVFVKID